MHAKRVTAEKAVATLAKKVARVAVVTLAKRVARAELIKRAEATKLLLQCLQLQSLILRLT